LVAGANVCQMSITTCPGWLHDSDADCSRNGTAYALTITCKAGRNIQDNVAAKRFQHGYVDSLVTYMYSRHSEAV